MQIIADLRPGDIILIVARRSADADIRQDHAALIILLKHRDQAFIAFWAAATAAASSVARPNFTALAMV